MNLGDSFNVSNHLINSWDCRPNSTEVILQKPYYSMFVTMTSDLDPNINRGYQLHVSNHQLHVSNHNINSYSWPNSTKVILLKPNSIFKTM